jgi:hypothetical protein
MSVHSACQHHYPTMSHFHTFGMLPSIEDAHSAKKRKVRKGTQSCWECKRRKVRCIYAVSTNTICDNCVRRKTTCISQEYPDATAHDATSQDAPERRSEGDVEARLSRVEDMLQQLVNDASIARRHGSALLLDEDRSRYHSEYNPGIDVSHVEVPVVRIVRTLM